MRFTYSDGGDFEIPDDWWFQAGMDRFRKDVSDGYVFAPSQLNPGHPVTLVPLVEMEPVHRAVAFDFDGFDRARMVRILQGFVAGDAIEPVPLNMIDKAPYRFAVYDGFRRFHAAVAAGLY